MIPLSILDLSPVAAGSNPGQALNNSRDLAQHAERLGYKRLWLAEHHNMPGIASAATAVALAHVASGTSTIRLGSGGIMLPNHAPLMVAEAFGTLAALYPGRIDLGVGRAPGTDQVTSNALRRSLNADVNAFPRDVVELMGYFKPVAPDQRVQAVPGAGLEVPVWILGSSLFGAQLAAMLGLPFAFASHFAAADMEGAMEIFGRAPGTDQVTSNALRRSLNADVNAFPRDVVELMGYFKPVAPDQRVQAVPGAGLEVPVWILGSSLFGAQLAAMLGLPFAFASHFAAADMEGAMEIYRARFEPSEHLAKPYVMLGLNVVAADTDAEARFLQSSRLQAFVNLRTGRAGLLPPPIENYEETLDPIGQSVLHHMQFSSVVGSPQTVKAEMEAFIRRTGADEIMTTNMIFDHARSVRSYEILADVMALREGLQTSVS